MDEDRPTFDALRYQYGPDFPNTPANAGPTIPPAQASAGPMLPAQLQQSSHNDLQMHGTANALQVVQGNMTRLSSADRIGDLELRSIYKQTLRSIFHANLKTLSYDLIVTTFSRAANAVNRDTLLAFWHHDWTMASSQELDDRIITLRGLPSGNVTSQEGCDISLDHDYVDCLEL